MWLQDRNAEVGASPDFRRVHALPTQDVSRFEGLGRELSQDLSPLLRKPGSSATLKWPQALGLNMLYDSYHQRGEGLYAGLPPGAGKTLITFTAQVVLGISHAVLVAPASLHRDKTGIDWARYSEDWHLPPRPPTLVNLEALSLDKNLYYLDQVFEEAGDKPKLVLFDECDLGRNWESAAVKRLDRFRADHEEAIYVCLTGSGMRFDCKDYAHHVNWCLHRGGSPFPYDTAELERWAKATAPKVRGKYGAQGKRPRAGALLELFPVPETDEVQTEAERAADILCARVNATPGVLILNEDDCDQPMTINLVLPPEDAAIDDAMRTFLREWTFPDGFEVIDSLGFWRGVRTVSYGYYEVIDVPERLREIYTKWALARRLYARRVKRIIQATADSDDPSDTPLAVEKAFPDDPIVQAWKEIKPSFKPENHRKAVWISDSVVDFAIAWGRKHRSLIWSGSVEFAERVSAKAGWRYYGAEGKAADGAIIEHAPVGEPAVVSIRASGRGQNLQRFNRGLVVQAPQSADERHQLYKRFHRFGQEKPVVWDELIGSGAMRDSFDTALEEAEGVKKQRKQEQIILRAEIVDCIFPTDAHRWTRKRRPKQR